MFCIYDPQRTSAPPSKTFDVRLKKFCELDCDDLECANFFMLVYSHFGYICINVHPPARWSQDESWEEGKKFISPQQKVFPRPIYVAVLSVSTRLEEFFSSLHRLRSRQSLILAHISDFPRYPSATIPLLVFALTFFCSFLHFTWSYSLVFWQQILWNENSNAASPARRAGFRSSLVATLRNIFAGWPHIQFCNLKIF